MNKLDLTDVSNTQLIDAIRVINPFYRTNSQLFTYDKAQLEKTLYISLEQIYTKPIIQENAMPKDVLIRQLRNIKAKLEHRSKQKGQGVHPEALQKQAAALAVVINFINKNYEV